MKITSLAKKIFSRELFEARQRELAELSCASNAKKEIMNKNESKQTKESGETNPNEIINKGKEQCPSRPFYGQIYS